MQITAAQLAAFLATIVPVIVPWLTQYGFETWATVLGSIQTALTAGGTLANLVVATINDVIAYVLDSLTVWLPKMLSLADSNPTLAALVAKL